jgi:5-hydroxyisourate hydrolase-like protein (transthyretin family)
VAPRVRFTVRSMMVAVACSAVTLAYLGTGSTKLGCGSASVLLTFHVVDDLDGRPVARARVELIRDYTAPPTASAITETDGCVRVGCNVGATSSSGSFFRQYRCLHYGEAVQVQAEGYESVDKLLREYTTSPDYHNLSVPPPIMIRLRRSPESIGRRG